MRRKPLSWDRTRGARKVPWEDTDPMANEIEKFGPAQWIRSESALIVTGLAAVLFSAFGNAWMDSLSPVGLAWLTALLFGIISDS